LRSYSADEFDSEPVHPGVLAELSSIERESEQLLFDSTYMFPLNVTSFDKNLKSIDSANMVLPSVLVERPGFMFLLDG